MSYDDQNIFAKILRGEAPAHVVFEDDATLAFMDVMPQTEGHTLVVPKAASVNLLDAAPEQLAHCIQTVQTVAAAVKRAFACDGVMIMQLNNAAAGQSVFHLHFHILPRNDGLDMSLHAREFADPELLAGHAARIRAELERD